MHDLHFIFCSIRSFPCDQINQEILEAVIDVIKNRHDCNEFNQFRIAIQSIPNYRERYGFAQTQNVYCYFPLSFLKNEEIYLLLRKACEELLDAIIEKNEVKIYELADCLHNLPIYLLENNYAIPKSFWKNEISSYRRKWNKSFLSTEQKMFK